MDVRTGMRGGQRVRGCELMCDCERTAREIDEMMKCNI